MWHCSSLAPPLSQLLRKQATFLLSLVTHLNMLQSFIFTKLIVSHKVQPHSLYVVTQKGRSYIPWNPTSPRKAHGNVFIGMTFLQCVEAFFPTAVCFEREQNCEGHGPQSGQYLHSWGGVVATDVTNTFS